jgi:hypothetical protein
MAEAPTFTSSKPAPPSRVDPNLEEAAQELYPRLSSWVRKPLGIVDFVSDADAYFGVRPQASQHPIEKLPDLTWGKGGDFVLDFGIHLVGYLSFRLESRRDLMDAPCRLRLTFGESPLDVTMGMENVDTWISTSWLPVEIVTVDDCPEYVHIRRRHSFRYLRVEIIDTSPKYHVSFSDVQVRCVSAVAQDQALDAYSFENPVLRDMDHVSIFTLRDCMQTVFEDGPRRDRRLWSGDLRLQALANYSTFRNFDLVKRCIYQFAATAREDGTVPACIFEKPQLAGSTDYIVDYDALFGAIVYDYVSASGDTAVGQELWPILMGCVKRGLSFLHPDTHAFDESLGDGWCFLDWMPGLEHSAGEHGVLLFSLKSINKLAALLGKEAPFLDTVQKMTAAADAFVSEDGRLIVSGPAKQVSYASASWLVLAEAFPPEKARSLLLNTLAEPSALKPLTPYLWHHVCDALATAGCFEECVRIMTEYWGGMLTAGADTFWECFDPEDPKKSPYGDIRNNSFCHAWSCTPTYLLRGKLLSFVGTQEGAPVTVRELDEAWIRRQYPESRDE